ncbi:hypothetical protein C8Q73DRAFT_715675 [Cubamyces lactineus]|nr:hypothetical protein C8Q73DRAFT_715675 [Cubamyces lactineus]
MLYCLTLISRPQRHLAERFLTERKSLRFTYTGRKEGVGSESAGDTSAGFAKMESSTGDIDERR